MYKQMRLSLRDPFKQETGARLVTFEPPILSHRPGNQGFVEMPEHRIHRRWTIPPVVFHPAPQDWIVKLSDILQAETGPVAEVEPSRLLPHGGERCRADRGGEAHKQTVSSAILHHPRPKRVPEEVKLRVRVLPFPTAVLAVDNPAFVWMQFQAAFG